jgi:hypothetical protein
MKLCAPRIAHKSPRGVICRKGASDHNVRARPTVLEGYRSGCLAFEVEGSTGRRDPVRLFVVTCATTIRDAHRTCPAGLHSVVWTGLGDMRGASSSVPVFSWPRTRQGSSSPGPMRLLSSYSCNQRGDHDAGLRADPTFFAVQQLVAHRRGEALDEVVLLWRALLVNEGRTRWDSRAPTTVAGK